MVLTSVWFHPDGDFLLILYSLCISGLQTESEPKKRHCKAEGISVWEHRHGKSHEKARCETAGRVLGT